MHKTEEVNSLDSKQFFSLTFDLETKLLIRPFEVAECCWKLG